MKNNITVKSLKKNLGSKSVNTLKNTLSKINRQKDSETCGHDIYVNAWHEEVILAELERRDAIRCLKEGLLLSASIRMQDMRFYLDRANNDKKKAMA